MKSRRQRILEAIRARLQVIAIQAGFQTDAGQTVFMGEATSMGPSDPATAICIMVGDDNVRYQGEKTLTRLPIEIAALAKADSAEPWVAVEQLLSDIKRAIELPDRALGGLVVRQMERESTRTLERQPGVAIIGVSITYICPFAEPWGSPEL